MDYDAKERCCGWCYSLGATMKCAKCPRAYCSRDCQVKDCKVGRHKAWCGKAGEKCVDYEIREAGGDKGLGLFVTRDFQRGEKILVERAVAIGDGSGQSIGGDRLENENVRKAVMALAPAESTDLNEIFQVNCAELGDDDDDDAGTGLFLNFSRVNHDCVGNCAHYWDPELGLKLLVASLDIPEGSEVSFSYGCNKSTVERTMMMVLRGFQCTCSACRNPEISAKLDRKLELDKTIMKLGSQGKTEQAIRAGTALLKIYDELRVSDRERVRTYYDLYQVAIAKQKTVKKGIKFIQEAYKYALRFYGREENIEVQKFKRYVTNPSCHHNYRCIN